MLYELVAARFQECHETTAVHGEHGKPTVAVMCAHLPRAIRRVWSCPPLLGGRQNLLSDTVEECALATAFQGHLYEDCPRLNRCWSSRAPCPLNNILPPQCVLCHTRATAAFSTQYPGPWNGVEKPRRLLLRPVEGELLASSGVLRWEERAG